jgi:hypothetical protein
MSWNLCNHGQNQYYCSQCNPMNLEALDLINPRLFEPSPIAASTPMSTWKEQFPSGSRSVVEQVKIEQKEILTKQPPECLEAATEQIGCYPDCFYYTDSCFRKDCKKQNSTANQLDDIPFGMRK